jgi:hypothetical protein
MDWLSQFVLRLKLCPFATRPLVTHSDTEFEYIPYSGESRSELLALIERSVNALAAIEPPSRKTAVVVLEPPFPAGLEVFSNFNDFLEEEVNAIPAISPQGKVQVAPFHPHFEFAGSDDDRGNYVNRSPFPMFHILREAEVTAAIETYETPETASVPARTTASIWNRNAKLMSTFTVCEVELAARNELSDLPGAVASFIAEEEEE